jgi:segregation and condensation protein A
VTAELVDVREPADVDAKVEPSNRFTVRLRNFEGPFDLLLQLISQRKMDVTEVALHQVTDDFIAYTRALGANAGLEETTEFLVIAATLLDLKTARLLPSGLVEDAEDLALLEAKDLIFARLLQYRAYKQVAALFHELEAAALCRYPRSVSLEERFAALLPEVLLGVDAAHFADVAAAAFRPAPPPPEVSLAHLHTPRVSVQEQAALMLAQLQAAEPGSWTGFSELVADCEHTMHVVARFLGLLELYREAAVVFDQEQPLGTLLVQLSGAGLPVVDALGEDYT